MNQLYKQLKGNECYYYYLWSTFEGWFMDMQIRQAIRNMFK